MTIPKQLLEAKICNEETCKLQEKINKVLEYIDLNYYDFTYIYSKNEDLKCIHLDNMKDILKGSDSNDNNRE